MLPKNGKKGKTMKKIGNIVITILVLLILVSLFVLGFLQNGDEPTNPIGQSKISYSNMYAIEGDELKLSKEAVSALKENKKTDPITKTKKEKKEENKKKKKSTKKQQEKSSKNTSKKTDSSSKETQKTEETIKESSENTTEEASEEQTTEGSEHKEPEESSEESTSNEPIQEEYFTTSIKDGEIVTSLDYEFTITHLHKELDVVNVTVFVNGDEVSKFSGKVSLQEGNNNIKVSVIYSDSYGRKIQAEKSYNVIADTATLVLSTDLKNTQVESPYFEFNASASYKEEKVDVKVTLNGETIEGENEHYSVTLAQGKNQISLEAKKDKYRVKKNYTVEFVSKKDYSIYTNLKNQTVNNENFKFKALIVNGTSKAKLTVIVNGDTITGNKGSYETILKSGNNTIRLKATDTGAESINETYTIKYVPVATKETEPILKYINVSDGMEINGETFTLKLSATDYKGNPIYYDGVLVRLNGKKIQYIGSGDYIRYKLKLNTGENQLEVRLTDDEGRYKDFNYTLNCTYIKPGTPIGTATITMDAKVLHLGTLMKSKVEVCYGDTAATLITRALDANGFVCDGTGSLDNGFYLSGVSRSGITRGYRIDDGLLKEIEEDGLTLNRYSDTGEFICSRDRLGEFDFCQGSGWMYSVNGKYLSYGMSEYEPKDGDSINLRFTLAYGKDINAYKATGGSQGLKDSYEHTY